MVRQFNLFLPVSILFFYVGIVGTSHLTAQDITYEIYALKFGERTHKLSVSDIAVGAKGSDSLNVCFMYWLLKGSNGKTVLVDAGFSDDMEINPKLITCVRPDKILDEINIKPDDITDVIITHPHWDHIGGINLFPNAMIWMQKEDYNYFVGTAWQKEGNTDGFNHQDVLKIVEKNLRHQLTLVNGDNKLILPGITVYTGSKHTYESQFICVKTGDEKVIIASDNAWYYYNLTTLLPIPVTHDAKAYVKNLKRMRSMVKNIDLIIPGHDPLVFAKFTTVSKNVVKIK